MLPISQGLGFPQIYPSYFDQVTFDSVLHHLSLVYRSTSHYQTSAISPLNEHIHTLPS
jgi:hypothetical protein